LCQVNHPEKEFSSTSLCLAALIKGKVRAV